MTVRRPVLEVVNVAASASDAGPRTYEFQVADSQAALTGTGTTLVASQTGVPQGAGGRTSYTVDRDLQLATRYYWRSRAIQGSVPGQWSAVFRFRTDFALNTPPVIQSLTPSSLRNEVNAEIELRAVAQDQETSPSSLIYEWSAAGGTFTGSGPTVRWRAPSVGGPTNFGIDLVVIERYTVTDPDGRSETRENRATASTLVHVNDSTREITGLATTFIDDRIHGDRPAEVCVANFSDNCPGKAEELSDIRNDRAMSDIDPSASGMGSGSIGFFTDSSRRTPVLPSATNYAVWTASCRFTSTNKSTGRTGTASGTCELTAVYENWQWFLCDSRFLNVTASSTGLSVLPTTRGFGSLRLHHQ